MCYNYKDEFYKFSIDWLNVRIDVENPFVFLDELYSKFGFEFEQRFNPVNFYKQVRYIAEAGHSSCLFAWNEDNDGNFVREYTRALNLPHGLFISISGDGCRYIENFCEGGLRAFCEFISKYNPDCTRIDTACDILDKENTLVPFIQEFARQAYSEDAEIAIRANLRRQPGYVTINTVYDDIIKDFTDNVTIGGRGSKKGTLQLYNKRVEIEQGRLSSLKSSMLEDYGNPDYWWRLEYRCKSFANNVFQQLLEGGVVAAYYQAANDFGDFVDTYYGVSNINKNNIIVIWSEFLEYLLKSDNSIHLVQFVGQKYVNTSFESFSNWILHNKKMFAKIHMLCHAYDMNPLLQEGIDEVLHHSPRDKAFVKGFFDAMDYEPNVSDPPIMSDRFMWTHSSKVG